MQELILNKSTDASKLQLESSVDDLESLPNFFETINKENAYEPPQVKALQRSRLQNNGHKWFI